MSAARSIPVADGDYTVTILGNVVELWSASEESGFSVFASELESLIDALLVAYIETGQAKEPTPTPTPTSPAPTSAPLGGPPR